MTGLVPAQILAARLAEGGVDPDEVRPGYVALALMVVLVVVTVLLWRNMRTQLGRISFDDGSDDDSSGDTSRDSSDGVSRTPLTQAGDDTTSAVGGDGAPRS